MNRVQEFDRISKNPSVMGGKPCIRGMQVTVALIASMVRMRHTPERLVADYPFLELEDVLQAVQYAALHTEKREISIFAY